MMFYPDAPVSRIDRFAYSATMSRAYKQPDPARAARNQGHTRIHKDLGGNVIGGYDATGAAYGTKTAVQGYSSRPVPTAQPAQPGQAAQPQAQPSGTQAATGNQLNARKALFAEMEKTGYENITPEMREKARSLGVQDQDFNSAVSRIKENSAYSGGKATAATATRPPTRQYREPATNVLGPSSPRAPIDPNTYNDRRKVNPATGLPFGTMPGDPAYAKKNPTTPTQEEVIKEQMRQENNKQILAAHYAKTGQQDPRISRVGTTDTQSKLPVKNPPAVASAPAGVIQPAAVAQTIPKPAQPTTSMQPSPATSTAMNSGTGNLGGSWRKPPVMSDMSKGDIQTAQVDKKKTRGW